MTYIETDREAEWIIAKLRGIESEAAKREYSLDIKPSITGRPEYFSAATDPDYYVSREAVNLIIEDFSRDYGIEVIREDYWLILYHKNTEVDRFPLDRFMTEREVQKRNIEGSFIYGAGDKDLFSIIPPNLQNT